MPYKIIEQWEFMLIYEIVRQNKFIISKFIKSNRHRTRKPKGKEDE